MVKKEIYRLVMEEDTDPSKGYVAPSQKVISDVCEKEKFCKRQGPITFGQLKKIVETAQNKNLAYDIGEGFYKAMIRLLPWFFPQIAVAGFIGSSVRAFNKVIKPGLEDTRGYKSWWGKTVLKLMDSIEGNIPHNDPISKIFFISDGLLHMMDRKFKLKFARYIAELASSKPDDEPVPEYFVENELRNWLNQKFLLNPPLQKKTQETNSEEILPFDQKIEEGFKLRTFSKNVESEELKWHFDDRDREVTILESNGWVFQMDNKLPQVLKEGDKLFIPKGVYHRVMKGKGDLKIKILEF